VVEVSEYHLIFDLNGVLVDWWGSN
jgi:hypothetical protein